MVSGRHVLQPQIKGSFLICLCFMSLRFHFSVSKMQVKFGNQGHHNYITITLHINVRITLAVAGVFNTCHPSLPCSLPQALWFLLGSATGELQRDIWLRGVWWQGVYSFGSKHDPDSMRLKLAILLVHKYQRYYCFQQYILWLYLTTL